MSRSSINLRLESGIVGVSKFARRLGISFLGEVFVGEDFVGEDFLGETFLGELFLCKVFDGEVFLTGIVGAISITADGARYLRNVFISKEFANELMGK